MPEIDPRLRFVLVTGTPGAGKTTLTASLRREPPGWSWIAADLFTGQYEAQLRIANGGVDVPWEHIRHPGYALARMELRTKAADGQKVLVEATVPTELEVTDFVSAAGCEDDPGSYRVVQLICQYETHVSRRLTDSTLPVPWGPPRSVERRAMIREVHTNRFNQYRGRIAGALVIETDTMSPAQVLDQVRRGLL